MSVRTGSLREVSTEDVRRLVLGYESKQRYEVRKTEDPGSVEIALVLTDLAEPFVKRFATSDVMVEWYQSLLTDGFSFGAWDSERLVGLALAERRDWNESAMVWELHVEETSRGRGVGRRLLEHVEEAARGAGLRTVVCETQTPNVAAIQFYRTCGYELEGVDLSYYSNEDVERGEVALFMKKRVSG